MSELPKATVLASKWGDRLFLDEDEFPWPLTGIVDWDEKSDGSFEMIVRFNVRDVELTIL